MKRAKGRLSSANVMSTIAVFLAIGGSALAVSQINGKRLVDQSVGGKKLKKKSISGNNLKADTITGKQVNESKLGKVPSAKSADVASYANTANTSTSASTAITANNAFALGGLPPSAYALSGSAKVLAGAAPLAAASPRRLFSSAPAKLDVSAGAGGITVGNDGGTGDLVATTYPSSGRPQRFRLAAGASHAIGRPGPGARGAVDTVVSDPGRPGRSVWVHCLRAGAGGAPTAYCWGLEAGGG